MPNVLTTDSTVLCGVLVRGSLHGGSVKVSGTDKLKVNGGKVLLKSGIVEKSVAGCQNTQPPTGKTPCKNVSQVTTGEAIKLKVGGNGVIIESTLTGVTDGTPPGPLSATAGQTKLTAI